MAVHPKHLSLWERMRGTGKWYDPEADFKAKIADMREDWTEKQEERKRAEVEGGVVESDDEYSQDIHDHFAATTAPANGEKTAGKTETTQPGTPRREEGVLTGEAPTGEAPSGEEGRS